jgi:hypothetical protein
MRFSPPLSLTPVIVNVIVSRVHGSGGDIAIAPPEREPLLTQLSQASSQQKPLAQQFGTGQHSVPPQQVCPASQHSPSQQTPGQSPP